jgi:hypothetical protein
MRAPSKAQLKDGIPLSGSKKRMQTFDLDHFDQHEDRPQQEHAELLQGIRDGAIHHVGAEAMGGVDFFTNTTSRPTQAECETLALALDSAYQFSLGVEQKMANDQGSISSATHQIGATWVNFFYLCDRLMHLLTADADFPQSYGGNSQM